MWQNIILEKFCKTKIVLGAFVAEALEVCSRRGAIQIHVYLYLTLPYADCCAVVSLCRYFVCCQ